MVLWLKRILVMLLASSLLGVIALFGWIWQPLDSEAWRVRLPTPGGGIQVRVVPMLMLATSTPGRWLLDRKAFSVHHGDIQLYDADGLRVHCRQCWLHAQSISDRPLMIPQVDVWIQMRQHQFKGYLRAGDDMHTFQISFSGWASMRRLRMTWRLPQTPLSELLRPLHAHSLAIARANVEGTLSATGTLRWPKPKWSAQPVLRQLKVGGLDISAATAQPVRYDCPLLDEHKHPEKMQWLPYDKLGRWLPMATIIAEDAEFRHHPGYAITQMLQILGKESADKPVGGSTITQQLAKYFFTRGERSWKRKIEELLYAVQLEEALDKTQILTLYLNTLDWGPSLCGAHAAAQYYFGVPPNQLNPIQAAWLAGIIRNPHRAWKQQFTTRQPNLTRAESILRFMPERARKQPGSLNFLPAKAG
ncbi:biosynthetic peptidoglycan transglycosylase [Methylophilus aquaticus]|uniref:Biosynthetic peptidoglycan transglycosylase n=1 Tax=Methylophilus aquaticus TaxID=1971610 RepID=A0ABT9JTN1_9PROT|nr:biosynthetic peptidoglycan transglycosylase [Methylophilus aquaticus]MDP8567943.1 biosynthetic peptidoglycan transglycosylase [Methylophilus aquaticus]